MTILFADRGFTKTDRLYTTVDGNCLFIQTKGIYPFFRSSNYIYQKYYVTQTNIPDKLCRMELHNRYLARHALFISKNSSEKHRETFVRASIYEFLDWNVLQIPNTKN